MFTPSSDVPVFPPIEYPSTFAFFPVPSETTDPIILNTSFAVFSEITLSPFFTSIFVTLRFPFSSFSVLLIICLTTLGFTYVPPFAIVDNIVAICIGVTSNLWPKDIVPSSTGPTFSSFRKIEPASPGKSTPVVVKNPNLFKYS